MDPDAARTDGPMEARIARIESDVAHMRADVADVKADQRSLRDKIDGLEATLRGEIKHVETSLLQKFERLSDGQGSLRAEIASAKNWGLGLSMTMTGVMLTVIAQGFGWI